MSPFSSRFRLDESDYFIYIYIYSSLLAYSPPVYSLEREREGERMERALTKVNSLKVGSLWISKKAKEEFSNISDDLTVSTDFVPFLLFLCVMWLG